MRIKIINPNTTGSMTERMGLYARRIAAPGTEIVAVSPDFGPPSIEDYYDEALAVPGLLAEIRQGEAEEFDGYVIACFGDPGLHAARELARGPVVGIAEAAMHFASVIAPGFSVVTTLARTCGMAWHLAEIYGMKRFCRNVRAVEIPVLDLSDPKVTSLMIEECKRALTEDGAGAIVLGCAGMVDLCEIHRSGNRSSGRRRRHCRGEICRIAAGSRAPSTSLMPSRSPSIRPRTATRFWG